MNTPVIHLSALVHDQRSLFLANRSQLDPAGYAALWHYESQWVSQQWDALALAPASQSQTQAQAQAQTVSDFDSLRREIDAMCASAPADLPPDAYFLAEQANRAQFACMVEHFALDGLTEAQSFLPMLPRLPYAAQMPLMRIFIDEFGCGNLQRMHSHLYCHLLAELGADTALEPYVARGLDPVFAFVNIFHWMTKRTPRVEYFLGALAWFESVVPTYFAPWLRACERLGIANHAYFSEHIHIDPYHAQSALLACRETAKCMPFAYDLAWQGARLAAQITDRAFEAVVAQAREVA
jgi:hypothetical protein